MSSTRPDLVVGDDGLTRCAWGAGDAEYSRYHDEEWGTPMHDRATVREALPGRIPGRALLDHDPEAASRLPGGVLRLRSGARRLDGRARCRTPARRCANHSASSKIEATIGNARATLALEQPIDEFLWSFAPPRRPRPFAAFAEVPATTPESTALSKALRARGFRFVGPTTMYALMQASGMVDDHLEGCFRSTAQVPTVQGSTV